MKKLILIPIVAGIKIVLKKALKVGSGGKKTMSMLAVLAKANTHKQPKNKWMLLQ